MLDEAKPLAECREEDLVRKHALVYGRAKIWSHSLTDMNAMEWRWSAYAWWKAMWYPHRGKPSSTCAWGVYGGSGGDGYTGPGDAQLTHFLPMPPVPAGASAHEEG